jgi:NAD(P)-dependent dehydrogenase (short-subunit alcohol dehydrogenase family)
MKNEQDDAVVDVNPRGLAAFALSGKVTVVTGGGRGLGRAIAEGLAAAGAAVVTCTRSLDEAEEVADRISSAGGRALGVVVDVTEQRSCGELIDRTVAAFGRIDVLVNNAGIEIVRTADECGDDDWQRTLRTNLVGSFHCAQLAAVRMRQQGSGGSIINVSSIASTIAMPGLAAYGASKAAVNQLTRTLATEWAASGIRVNAIAPGYMDNRMRDGGMTSIDRVRAVTPLGRRGRPEELVGPVVFLASDAASYVTGMILFVDGGTTLV